MRLRSKIVLLISVMAIMLVACTLAICKLVITPQFAQIERAQAESDITRCRKALERDFEYISSIAHDWAAWDDTYQYIHNRNSEFEKGNLIPATFANLKINLLALIGMDGRLVWGEIRDRSSQDPMEVPGLLESVAESESPLAVFSEPSQHVSGILMTAGGPMVVSGRPIVTSEREGPVRGALVMGRFLDDAAVTKLIQQTQVTCTFRSLQGIVADADREIASQIVTPNGIHLHEEDEKTLRGYAVIRDVYGQPALLLQAEIPRTISLRGKTATSIATMSSLSGSLLTMGVLWVLLRRFVVNPLGQLTHHAVRVGAQGDLQAQINMPQTDEIGTLAGEFDRMVRRLAEQQARLTETAHKAGMAEVAIGVLHNVGNVLNSVNTSAGVVMEKLHRSEVSTLNKVNQLIEQNAANLPTFLTEDERGRQLPSFLGMLATTLETEHDSMLKEMGTLAESLEHVAKVISQQQEHCQHKDLIEAVSPVDLVERAIAMCISPNAAQRITLIRRFEWTEPARLCRHKVLQILGNLVRNACRAVLDSDGADGRIEISIEASDAAGTGLRFTVRDNGVGIASDDLTRLFAFGFTRRSDGHGFGLHSSANLAREMGGSLTAHSDGPGTGATFQLEIPLVRQAQTAGLESS